MATANASKPVNDTQVQATLDTRYVRQTQVSAANGVAPLDSAGKVPTANLPTSSSPVTSVAGRTGTVVLTKADVGLSSVDNTSDVNKPVSSAAQAQLNVRWPDVRWDGVVAQPARPVTAAGVPVKFWCPVQPAGGGTVGGGGNAVTGLDFWMVTAS